MKESLLTEEQQALVEICWQVLCEGNMGRDEFEQKVSGKIYGKQE